MSIFVRRSCPWQGVSSNGAPQAVHVVTLAMVTVSLVRVLLTSPKTFLPLPLLKPDVAVSSLGVWEGGMLEF